MTDVCVFGEGQLLLSCCSETLLHGEPELTHEGPQPVLIPPGDTGIAGAGRGLEATNEGGDVGWGRGWRLALKEVMWNSGASEA